MKELILERDGRRIYGHYHLPEGEGPFPCVIICHGLGGNLTDHEYYAQVFAENGIAAYCFDFIGGGPDIQSDGKMTEMSVRTEIADLNAVISAIVKRPETDSENIYLMGGSQGGYVITYCADERPDEIRGIIPLYPAYVISDFLTRKFRGTENIPETFRCIGFTVSSIYASDAFDIDIYSHMNFPGKVLIIHGTADRLVPLSYSERALTVFPDAELFTIEGADHGFWEENEKLCAKVSLDFVRKTLKKH